MIGNVREQKVNGDGFLNYDCSKCFIQAEHFCCVTCNIDRMFSNLKSVLASRREEPQSYRQML